MPAGGPASIVDTLAFLADQVFVVRRDLTGGMGGTVLELDGFMGACPAVRLTGGPDIDAEAALVRDRMADVIAAYRARPAIEQDLATGEAAG